VLSIVALTQSLKVFEGLCLWKLLAAMMSMVFVGFMRFGSFVQEVGC
jgi:hypothetical protein